MKKYLLLLTLSLSLFAQNPKSFAALGDVIYDDVDKFEKLKEMPSMQEFRSEIDNYIASASETKKMGFSVDAKDPSVNGKAYLKALRELSTEHDTIIMDSRNRFKEAMSDEDSETINQMIDYGVVDPEDYKDALIRYYEEFGEDQNLSSLNDLYTQYLKNSDKSVDLSASQKEVRENEARVKRMRAQDKAQKEALAASVKEEKEREKKKVLNEQKKELGIE